jgi:hypothetical protein
MEALTGISKGVKFDAAWWEHFLETTSNMSRTAVLKDCISSEDISKMKKLILQVIVELAKMRTNHHGYRVFINNKLLDANEMNMIYDAPPTENESIEDWCKRIFKGKEFGIIINSGERFNPELAKMLAIKAEPLFEQLGFPVEGINFTLFIGNYGHTPIGIHQDMPGENVIHYHLGPGKKRMYTWSKQLYEELEKVHNHKNISKFLPDAEVFTFEEGDLYFMPQGVYHIGEQESLSTALTFWFYHHAKNRVIEKLHTILIEQYLTENDELLLPDKLPLEDHSRIEDILSTYQLPGYMERLTIKEALREAYKDLRYSINSNAGYRTSPFPREESIVFTETDRLIAETPYKIRYRDSLDGESLYIYVRGMKIAFKNFNCIKEMIDVINTGDTLTTRAIISLLDATWGEEIGHYVLSLFYKYHAICLVK